MGEPFDDDPLQTKVRWVTWYKLSPWGKSVRYHTCGSLEEAKREVDGLHKRIRKPLHAAWIERESRIGRLYVRQRDDWREVPTDDAPWR